MSMDPAARSSSSNMLDIYMKATGPVEAETFNKLLQECDKIRMHNKVLKKAVLQEQEKTKTLENTIKDKEDKIRSQMEEIDIIGFNNQRLTKRLAGLQEDIADKEKKGSVGWFGGGKQLIAQKQEELEVLQTELSEKIKQNASLHGKLHEQKVEHDQATDVLQQKLSTLKMNFQQKQEELDIQQKQYSEEKTKMEREANKLVEQAHQLNQEIKSLQFQMSDKDKKMTAENHKLKEELSTSLAKIKSKILFDDTKITPYNQLNLPSYDKGVKIQKSEIANKNLENCEQLAKAYEGYHSSMQEKLVLTNRTAPEELRKISTQIIGILPDFARHLTELLSSLRVTALAYTKPSSEINKSELTSLSEEFLDKLNNFVNFNKNLQVLLLARLDEESKAAAISPAMKARNGLIGETYSHIQLYLDHLLVHTKSYFRYETREKKDIEVLRDIQNCFANLERTMKTFTTQMTSKLSNENKDPAISTVLKESNDSLVKWLNEITAKLGKLITGFDEYHKFLMQPTDVLIRGVEVNGNAEEVSLTYLENRAKNYMQFLNQIPQHDSIPYQETLQNRDSLIQFEILKKKMLDDIAELNRIIENLRVEKGNLQGELANAKDNFNSKQSQLASILEELAITRSQLSQMTASYQQQLQLVSQLLQEKDKYQHQKLEAPVSTSPVLVAPVEQKPVLAEPEVQPSSSPRESTMNLINFDDTEQPSISNVNTPISGSPVVTPKNLLEEHIAPTPQPPKAESPRASAPQPVIVNIPLPVVEVPVAPTKQSYTMTVLDENGNQSKTLRLTKEDKEREQAVKQFYESRITQLNSQLQIADAKAVEAIHNFQITVEELKKVSDEKEELQKRMENSSSSVQNAKEDLDVTRANYEQQMNVLTEHITLLNDKLAHQTEELGNIKAAKVVCGKCKKLNTIEWLMTEGKNGMKCIGGNHNSSFQL